MYYYKMERKKLKQILIKFYSVAMANMILRGERRPSYEIICQLHSKYEVPFNIWLDIKSYVSNSNNTANKDKITRV